IRRWLSLPRLVHRYANVSPPRTDRKNPGGADRGEFLPQSGKEVDLDEGVETFNVLDVHAYAVTGTELPVILEPDRTPNHRSCSIGANHEPGPDVHPGR